MKRIGKYTILLTEDYDRLRNERNALQQREWDMFNGKRCSQFRLKQAETDAIHEAYDKLKRCIQYDREEHEKTVDVLNKNIEALEDMVRALCREIVRLKHGGSDEP